MDLNELLSGVKTKSIVGDVANISVTSLTFSSDDACDGALYFCITGDHFDGHDFVKTVVARGAVCVVAERPVDAKNAVVIVVDDVRDAMGKIAANFYGHPEKKMRIVGITGTNGKTTTAFVLTHVLNESGVKAGCIGTLGVFFDGKAFPPTLTTPDTIDLFKILKEMADCGVKVAVMEVSAHAAYLKKVAEIPFYLGVFTNFTQDHLDFFKTMESYKAAKLSFLNNRVCRYLLLNSDDSLTEEIKKTNHAVLTYGIENPSDVFAVRISCTKGGVSFFVNLFDEVYEVFCPITGVFNVYNVLAALEASSLLGVSVADAVRALKTFRGVDGRLERVYGGNYDVYVDYAHTPDGLKKALDVLKKVSTGKLVCLFGCGGNRDKGKRPLMGKIAGERADFTVLTSDNPRFEDPMEIIHEIESGLSEVSSRYVAVENREMAIGYALSILEAGDTLLVAGKGAEKYQEILGIKHPFDDKDTVRRLLKGE